MLKYIKKIENCPKAEEEKMKPKRNNWWLIISLILTTTLFRFTDACIGEDGRVPPFISIPVDLTKLPTDQQGWIGINPTLVILIDFPNCTGTYNEGNWHTILLSAPNNPRTSMRDYYHEVSYFFTNEGLDLPPAWETFGTQNNGVVGWYRMPFNHPFTMSGGDTFWENRTGRMHESVPDYAAGWYWGQQLAVLALKKADQHVNFALYGSPYGQQGSPWVVSSRGLQIVVVIAGFEASYSGLQNHATWRHYWFLPGMGYLSQDPAPEPYYQTYVGGQNYGGGYAMVGEKAANGSIIGQGLVAHEIGHGIGLPDLYDTRPNEYGFGDGVGEWCLMAGGDWLGNPAGTKPAHFSAWAKIDRGWLTPNTIWASDSSNAQFPKIESLPVVFRMNPYNQPNSKQYFLIENRQQTSFDAALPGTGLLIYHIDDSVIRLYRASNRVNNRVGYTNDQHYGVDVECQDGYPCGSFLDHLDVGGNGDNWNRGDTGDPWVSLPDFNANSTPNSNFYYGVQSYVAIENISQSANVMTADLLYWLPHDVGALTILSPTGEVKKDSTITPSAIVKNFGSSIESPKFYLKIGTYIDSFSPTLNPKQIDTISFRPWLASETGTFTVKCTSALAGDMKESNDLATTSVTVTKTPGAGWSKKHDISNQASGKSVKGGGGITGLEGKGNALYLILGNNTRDFLKYDITGNSWSKACTIPAGPNNKKVKKGAYIVDDENYVYILKGGGTQEFYKYDPASNSWNALNEPGFTKGIKGGFASYVNYNGNYIYAGSGAGNNEWKKFNLVNGNWESATPASLPVEKTKIGSGLAYDGIKRIYFLAAGGKQNYFYYLDLSLETPTWVKIESLPLIATSRKKKVKEGGAIEFFGGKIYAVKGGNTKEFWSYEPEKGTWTYLGEIGGGAPAKGIKCGRSLTSTSDGLFCLIGNNTNEMWFYPGGKPNDKTLEPSISGLELSRKTFIWINPNPSRGSFKVSYILPRKEKAKISIYNTAGQIVSTVKTDKTSYQINKLPAGVYILRFESASGGKGYKVEKKIVIME